MSIRFCDDTLGRSEITLALGEPTVGVAKGEPRVNEYGNESTAKTVSWRLVTEPLGPADFDRQTNDKISRRNDDVCVS